MEQCGTRAEEFVGRARLWEDLGIDSLDRIEVLMAIEDEFGHVFESLADEEAMEKIETFGEAVEFLQARLDKPPVVPVEKVDELTSLWERIADSDEFLKFDRVRRKRSQRPDLHAFLLLDALVPTTFAMVCAVAHDQIWLAVDLVDLAKVITEDQVIELVRCGVRYDSTADALARFV